MPDNALACENGPMTASTWPAPMADEWRLEAFRSRWDGLRAWDDGHQLASDAGVALVLLFTCLLFPHFFWADRPENIVFQVALIVPLIWRRRAPSMVFCAIATVAFVQWLVSDPLPADVALLVALFTLAVHAPPWRALAGAGVLLAGVIMASVRWGPAGDTAKSLLFLTGLVVAALFTGVALRTWRSYLDSLVEQTKRLEFERDQQARLAAAAERSRIAREMHDVVAHNVSVMVTLADGALATADAHPGRAKEAMSDVSATGRLALADMRHLLGVLRTDEMTAEREPQPQLSGLPRLISGVRSTGLRTEFEEDGPPFEIPPGVQLTIFRIVQESLTNVLKHAEEASSAKVRLTFDAPFVNVCVRDDGKPVGHSREGHGLGGMRERAAFCGGALTAGPQSEGGWEVMARIRVDR
jgi:signal transduction histidine kinase